MRNPLLALGYVATLAACGRSGSAARDAENVAAGDTPLGGNPTWVDDLDGAAGAGGTSLRADGAGIDTANGTDGMVGSGGTTVASGNGGWHGGGGTVGSAAGILGTGGSVGQGGATGTGGSTLVNCGITTVSIARAFADVLLVLDRSGSMANDIAQDCGCLDSGNSSGPACADLSTCRDRWTTLSSAVATAVTSSPDIRWGLKLFSTPGGSSCNVSGQVEVPIGANSISAIQQSIESITPANNTPTAQAIRAAADYLKTVNDASNKVILLATDGEPNCHPGLSTSSPNVDGTLAEIMAARDAGFPVYVIGIGPSVGNLDDFAAAGGTGHYYPATSPDQLTNAFADVSRLVASCTFLLSIAPPDPNNVAVYFDKSLLANDVVNGWSFAGGMQSVQLHGAACERLQSSMSATVTVLFGCPGTSLPPVLP